MVEPLAGWVFEDEWFHDDCSAIQGPGFSELAGVEHDESQHVLTCKDCGEQVALDTEKLDATA